ncbi:NAD(P)-binding protein [Saccharata proteae CBS 121410]|uniref:NAD(P)-binding protein n=1 Tax=Saccharata proteae CBS 121410 TaxID=1314787 RepID=A0A9P4LX32_9PEZI|nr:NAD(P)-binding protein [Saccharata proteae CBS 121410]
MGSVAQPGLPLAGKVAIVTGAARGIGVGIALELANRGAKVVCSYTSPSSSKLSDDLISKIKALNNGSDAIKVSADLKDPAAPAEIVSATTAAFGPHIDILVNNAGVGSLKFLPDITAEAIAEVYDVNVRAPILMAKAVLPHLRAPGRIINISSAGSRLGLPGFTIYASSKAALEGATRSLASELGEKGHTVNAVDPGPVESDMLRESVDDKTLNDWMAKTPVEKRIAQPKDIADVVAWLAEEQSRWVSGQTISATGGFLMI